MKSWQTTVAGVLTIVVAVGSAVLAIVDNDTMTNPDWAIVMAAITAGIGLIFSRDNNKTSESVGAK